MSVKLYFDFLSQPSRSVYIFLKLSSIPFEPHQTAIRKGEHLTDEFKQKNRLQRLPAIEDGDFKLGESVAIVRYLAHKFNIDSKWYPKDLRQRARVDEYLEWQHINTRTPCTTYFREKWLYPLTTGKQPDSKLIESAKANLLNTLGVIDNVWLSNSPFLAGKEISIADIFAASEIEQLRIAGFDPLEGHERLGVWLKKVRDESDPVYSEAHQVLNKLVQRGNEVKSKKQQ